jgi:NADH:ubiquinone oxidoreductase subunit D
VIFELKEEIITRMGYCKTEKLIEHKNYTQALPYFDRLDSVYKIVNERFYCFAIEKLFNCKVLKRTQYIRVLFAENYKNIKSFVSDRLSCYGCWCNDTFLLWAFEEQKKLMKFY